MLSSTSVCAGVSNIPSSQRLPAECCASLRALTRRGTEAGPFLVKIPWRSWTCLQGKIDFRCVQQLRFVVSCVSYEVPEVALLLKFWALEGVVP